MINNYNKNGLQVFEKFLSHEQILNLRKECTHLFSKTQLLGHGFSVRLNKVVSEIPYPTSKINSVNLLEVAIDIYSEIEKLGYSNMKLAHVALYKEENNDKELVWHSDLRNGGLIRAQIVIEGGALKSGAFRYIAGSHKLIISESFPTKEYLVSEKENIVVCDNQNGSMFLINTVGYHSKCVCQETRVSLMFDFLPESYILENPNDVSSDVALSSSRLSSKVIDNIGLFKSGVLTGSRSPNTPDFYKFHKPFGGSNFKEILSTFKSVFLKKINR